MKKLLLILTLIMLSGCASLTRQTEINSESTLTKESVVILVGLDSDSSLGNLTYLQFCPPGCRNFNVNIGGKNVVALPMTGKTKIFLDSISISNGRHIGAYGYYGIDNNVKLEINKPGIYWYGKILLKNNTIEFSANIDNSSLILAKDKYKKSINTLNPVNFKWP